MAERTAATVRPQSRSRRDAGPGRANTYPTTRGIPAVETAPARRPVLRVVSRPRVRYGPIVLLVAVLGLALLVPVGINLAVVRSQFRVAQLQQRMDDLIAERSTLKAEQAGLSSTQRVKETADRLGMVTPPEVGFIDLGGSVAGDAAARAGSAVAATGNDAGDGLVVASTSQEVGAGR